MSQSRLYIESQQLVGQGKYGDALHCLTQHLQREPCDGDAWNDVGVINYQLGKAAAAVDYLEFAASLSRRPVQVYPNLLEACVAAGMGQRVVGLLDTLKRSDLLNSQLVLYAVENFVRRSDIPSAVEILVKAMELLPEEQGLADLHRRLLNKRAKIAFFCGGDGTTFLKDILAWASRRFELRMFEGKSVEGLRELMEWSDISWFEWCTNLAQIGSNTEAGCKNIVRLHRYEAYLEWPRLVNWDNIDILITVGNNFVKQAIAQQVPDIAKRCRLVTIPNGLDISKIKFTSRRPGGNIAFVGNMRMVKNPQFLLECMHRLTQVQSGYKLYIAGRFDDALLEQYLRYTTKAMGLEDTVIFDGWQSDIQSWLEDKNYIVCTSLIESQGMGLLEAMAAGIKPLIHDFPGARGIFPADFIFNTVDQFCDKVITKNYDSQLYRSLVERRYTLSRQLLSIAELLNNLEEQIFTPTPEENHPDRPDQHPDPAGQTKIPSAAQLIPS